VRDDRLERRNHRDGLQGAANRVGAGLQLIGLCRLPVAIDGVDTVRVDIGARRDAPDPARPEVLQKKGLASREYGETGAEERVEQLLRVLPIVRGILDSGNRIGERCEQTADEPTEIGTPLTCGM
jgi:hypothetical protein